RFVIFTIPTVNVLIPPAERERFVPFAFSRARLEGRFIDFHSDPLFAERFNRLQAYFNVEEGSWSLDATEKLYIEDMIGSGKTLVQHSHPHILAEKNPLYLST